MSAPEFEVARGDAVRAEVDLLAVPATSGPDGPRTGAVGERLGEALGTDLGEELSALGFDGARAATARLATRGRLAARSILVVGLGDAETIDSEALRAAGAAVADAAARVERVATTLAAAGPWDDPAAAAQAVVEGISLAAYRFRGQRSEADEHRLERVLLYGERAALQAGVQRGVAAADAVRLARDLVNEPPGSKRPPQLAERVERLLHRSGVKVRVLDEGALQEGGYGGLLGVGAGSAAPPRLVELTYAPRGARRHVALVGKGITFDSGGLSLKNSKGMMRMKYDMAGAASVLATVRAAAAQDLGVRVTGLLALAENMPSGSATRPGDVLTIRGGRTVEVLNTDAEGRLVLADALAHASEAEPDAIVDLATLTGAVKVALGARIGGLMARDDALADQLLAAARRAGERLWRLPLPGDLYGEDLKSDVADIRNAGWDDAGTIRAGLFLQEFVAEGIPWAHLDIAGIAWSDEDSGHLRKGASGAPVRTLLEWLRSL